MKFIIDVTEGITEDCIQCPFNRNKDVCLYLKENDLCNVYDFTKLHIEEYENNN